MSWPAACASCGSGEGGRRQSGRVPGGAQLPARSVAACAARHSAAGAARLATHRGEQDARHAGHGHAAVDQLRLHHPAQVLRVVTQAAGAGRRRGRARCTLREWSRQAGGARAGVRLACGTQGMPPCQQYPAGQHPRAAPGCALTAGGRSRHRLQHTATAHRVRHLGTGQPQKPPPYWTMHAAAALPVTVPQASRPPAGGIHFSAPGAAGPGFASTAAAPGRPGSCWSVELRSGLRVRPAGPSPAPRCSTLQRALETAHAGCRLPPLPTAGCREPRRCSTQGWRGRGRCGQALAPRRVVLQGFPQFPLRPAVRHPLPPTPPSPHLSPRLTGQLAGQVRGHHLIVARVPDGAVGGHHHVAGLRGAGWCMMAGWRRAPPLAPKPPTLQPPRAGCGPAAGTGGPPTWERAARARPAKATRGLATREATVDAMVSESC